MNKKDDPGSAEVRIDETIRYKVKNPFNLLNHGSIEQIEKTIISYSTSLNRSIAAKVEMDPLIAKKSLVGKAVHGAFEKRGVGGKMEQAKVDISPKLSYLACATYVFLVGYLLPFVVLDMIVDLPILMTICISLIGISVGMAGWHEIPPSHMGVMTILGKRQHKLADEGNQWLPWPFADYIVVDVREKTIPNKGIKVFAGIDPNAGEEIQTDISLEIDSTYGPESGVDVLAVITEEIAPVNEEIFRAREALKVEKGKSEAQDEDMMRQAERARKLKVTLPGLSDKDVFLGVMAQEGRIVHRHFSVEGVGDADRLIGGFAAAMGEVKDAVEGIKEIKGKKGDKKDKKGGERK